MPHFVRHDSGEGVRHDRGEGVWHDIGGIRQDSGQGQQYSCGIGMTEGNVFGMTAEAFDKIAGRGERTVRGLT